MQEACAVWNICGYLKMMREATWDLLSAGTSAAFISRQRVRKVAE
jgi:hypothetical protein